VTAVGGAKSNRVLLGRIAGAHGIRGEVVIRTFTAAPESIGAYGPLSERGGRRTFTIANARVTQKGVVARLEGVSDRNEAEALKGVELYVERERLPAVDEGEFYHADLVGLAAVDPEGKAIGKIVAVHNFGAGDLLEIRLAGSGKTELVPFTDAAVPEVDIAGGRVIVAMPEGDASEEE
jgi:16S rRNA processing protein RimM